jgi:hypothetical protein
LSWGFFTVSGSAGPWLIAPGQTARWWIDWDVNSGPGLHPAAILYAIPPSIKTLSNRVVCINHGLEQPAGEEGGYARYTADFTCEDINNDGGFGVYRLAFQY